MTPIFEQFCNEAYDNDCKISIDCSWIPTCYWENDNFHKEQINENINRKICFPTIDILPNFKATCCFGLNNFVDCSLFNDVSELSDYFLFKQIVPLTNERYLTKCENCIKKRFLNCTCGCLNLKEKKENN